MDQQEQNQKQIYDEKKQRKDAVVQRALFKKKAKKVALISLGLALLLVLIKYSITAYNEANKVQIENDRVAEVKGEFFKTQGQEHIADKASHPAYNSNPPTSGWHYDHAYATGVYTDEKEDEVLVHNLEHGHIWIAYKPDLNPETVKQLRDMAYRFRSQIIMAPRPKNDVPIALGAWEYQLKLQSFDLDKILGFIKAHRGKGPEDVHDPGF